MAFHSRFNAEFSNEEAESGSSSRFLCGCPVLEYSTTGRGGSSSSRVGRGEDESSFDIVEEALYYFRANVFFRNYKLEGPADRVLLYLTMYISYVLKKLEATSSMEEKKKILQSIAVEGFMVPGDNGFPLNGFIFTSNVAREKEAWKNYIKGLREETSIRLGERYFLADGSINKFWACFAKRKFMNQSLMRF